MAKWVWAQGYRGRKKTLTIHRSGNQTDYVQFDTRGCVSINYFHRNKDEFIDKKMAWRGLRDKFKAYGENIIVINQYRNVYNTQVYFRYGNLPSTETAYEWIGDIRSVMNAC